MEVTDCSDSWRKFRFQSNWFKSRDEVEHLQERLGAHRKATKDSRNLEQDRERYLMRVCDLLGAVSRD